MDITSYLRQKIQEAIDDRFLNLSSFAGKAGVSQANLWGFMKGNRGLNLETASKIMEALDIELVTSKESTISRMGDASPKVPVNGDDLFTIGVFAVAGAGPAQESQDVEPIFSIKVPPSFAREAAFALLVDGDSMYPTIKNRAVVGVSRDVRFRQNEIFAVNIPYEGLAIKRVAIDHAEEQYVLRSDNPDKNKYGDIRILIEESPNLLAGRVVWVWQEI